MSTWRLILDGPADGAWNMAVDRAVLVAHEAGAVPPTLRLYSWERPTVSLGRFQNAEDVDRAVAEAHGVAVCRRPTGGRGVLHDDEVTYAVVAGVRDGLPRGVSASYRELCGALVEAYRALGVAAELTARTRGERDSGACYLHATPADLSLGAAKLSGSAQVWLRESCLQHGSFVVSRDASLEAALFGLGDGGARALSRAATTLLEATGSRPDAAAVRDAVVEGFGRWFGVDLEPGELTAAELVHARAEVGFFEV